MIPDYKPKVGDYVRITREGRVNGTVNSDVVFIDGEDWGIQLRGAKVEKIDPPVVKFKPGQRVRDKKVSEWEYTVGFNGYFDHGSNEVVKTSRAFTSRYYELVED